MIKNGRPYTNENGWKDDGLITSKPVKEQEIIFSWIRKNITPRKTPLDYPTSYGLKHILQRQTGIYLTNNEFKDAMWLSGFKPADPGELNWRYGISKKSLAFK